jgi:hypothetical protein
MIRIRRGVAIEVERARPGVLSILVEVAGSKERAIAYEDLCGPVRPGDRLVLNTGAVALGLGTGGVHFVIAVEGGEDLDGPEHGGHAMKLRYTPLQHAVLPVEESHRETMDAFGGLEGAPVVVAGLHSALAAAVVAAKAIRPEARVAYVMTEGGALPIAFSETVAALKDLSLVDVTITCGQAFGGDLEAVNKFSGIVAARVVANADLVIVAPGPGHLGTASRFGFASIETGEVVNAVARLMGRPIVAPRISFSDPRERHRGVSHHTLAALRFAALVPSVIAMPTLDPGRTELVQRQLAEAGLHEFTVFDVDLGPAEEALRSSPVPLRTMGRTFDEDPDAFRASAAAAVLAFRG